MKDVKLDYKYITKIFEFYPIFFRIFIYVSSIYISVFLTAIVSSFIINTEASRLMSRFLFYILILLIVFNIVIPSIFILIRKKRVSYQINEINKISNILVHQTNKNIILLSKEEEKKFRLNLEYLFLFHHMQNIKYSLIAMGSLVEFLLRKRYEKKPEISEGCLRKFKCLLELVIEENPFGKKESWKIINDRLREYRNYIHINAELEGDLISQEDYDQLRHVSFEVISELLGDREKMIITPELLEKIKLKLKEEYGDGHLTTPNGFEL